MKGYLDNTELYIFPQEADTFEVGEDVTKIYIQYEQLDAFKAENETIADLMVGYNYNAMTVKPKVWAGHTDDYEPGGDEPEPEPETYTITIDGDGVEYTTTTPENEAAEGDTVTITVDTTDFELGSIEVVDANNDTIETEGSEGEYTFIMPASDVTVSVYGIEYSISWEGSEYVTSLLPDVALEDEEITFILADEIDGQPAAYSVSGSYMDSDPNNPEPEIDLTITDNGDYSYSFTMPNADVTIIITSQSEPGPEPEPQP